MYLAIRITTAILGFSFLSALVIGLMTVFGGLDLSSLAGGPGGCCPS